MNEFEAHESSYDHQHKKRLKDMKEMQKQVQTASASKREEKGGPLMMIKLGSGGAGAGSKTGGGGGFKKGGFKNAFGPVDDGVDPVKREDVIESGQARKSSDVKSASQLLDEEDSDLTGDEDYYDPRKPTDCTPDCAYVTPV